ncbi:MAG: DUF87 domain-containing protein [Candidatus Bathyarchaeia archaeon]|nr:DUF87 domain-containing protein [Candidatus Bathyarchaeota archaeon]
MIKNNLETKLRLSEVLGKKVLILGEAGSGKTKMVAQILQELRAVVKPEEITVIDMAPERVRGLGGKITDYLDTVNNFRYLSPKKVYTPRISGASTEEVMQLAILNRRAVEPLIKEYIQSPTNVLIMNDVTIYLQLGNLETVLKCVRLARTFLATAYYGKKLAEDFGSGISAREKMLVEEMVSFMDLVVRTS